MGRRRKARVHAFQALYSWEVNQSPVRELLEFPWVESSDDDWKDFARHLVSGTLENLDEVDRLIQAQLEHWDFGRIGRVDLAVLRISTYALRFQTDIPATVTIDEAVALAKQFGSPESYRFVNGVLDGIQKARR